MLLNDIGKSPDTTFNKINRHLESNYGFKIAEDVSYQDLVAIMEQIDGEITELKVKGDNARYSPEISKRLLILEGLKTLREFALVQFQSPDLDHVVNSLSDFVHEAFRLSGTTHQDFEECVHDGMKQYRSSRYRFPDDMIEQRVRQNAMSKIHGVDEGIVGAGLGGMAGGTAGELAGGALGTVAGGALGTAVGGPIGTAIGSRAGGAIGAGIGDVAGTALGAKAGDAFTDECSMMEDSKKKMCSSCHKVPAMDSYSTCKSCHDDSLSAAERYYDVQEDLEEKWGGDVEVKHTGRNTNKSVADLRSERSKAKERGDTKAVHQKDFAIRAKTGWGKAEEGIEEAGPWGAVGKRASALGGHAPSPSGAVKNKADTMIRPGLALEPNSDIDAKKDPWAARKAQLQRGGKPTIEENEPNTVMNPKTGQREPNPFAMRKFDLKKGTAPAGSPSAGHKEPNTVMNPKTGQREPNPFAMRKFDLKRGTSPMREHQNLVKRLRYLLETEVSEAEVMMAAKKFAQELQEMIEKIGRLQNEDLPPVTDKMRETYGTESSSAFQTQIYGALQGVMDALYTAKGQVDDAVSNMATTGQVGAETDMDKDVGLGGDEMGGDVDVGMDADLDLDNIGDELGAEGGDMGDEFGGAGEEEPLGRSMKTEALQQKVSQMKQLIEKAKKLKEAKRNG